MRDTLMNLGFAMITIGASYATWALLTGPLGRYTKLGPRTQRRIRRPKPGASDARRPKRDAGDVPRT